VQKKNHYFLLWGQYHNFIPTLIQNPPNPSIPRHSSSPLLGSAPSQPVCVARPRRHERRQLRSVPVHRRVSPVSSHLYLVVPTELCLYPPLHLDESAAPPHSATAAVSGEGQHSSHPSPAIRRRKPPRPVSGEPVPSSLIAIGWAGRRRQKARGWTSNRRYSKKFAKKFRTKFFPTNFD